MSAFNAKCGHRSTPSGPAPGRLRPAGRTAFVGQEDLLAGLKRQGGRGGAAVDGDLEQPVAADVGQNRSRRYIGERSLKGQLKSGGQERPQPGKEGQASRRARRQPGLKLQVPADLRKATEAGRPVAEPVVMEQLAPDAR